MGMYPPCTTHLRRIYGSERRKGRTWQSLSGRTLEDRNGDGTMGMYPPCLYGPRGTHGARNRFSDGPARIAADMTSCACIRFAKRLYGPRRTPGTHGSANSLCGKTRKDASLNAFTAMEEKRCRKIDCRKDSRGTYVQRDAPRSSHAAHAMFTFERVFRLKPLDAKGSLSTRERPLP